MTLAALLAAGALSLGPPASVRLEVPILRQAPERCGPAALAMVIRHYRGGSASTEHADRAYDPVLRGALITDLAKAARASGFDAVVAHPEPDSLVALLRAGVPPILLYETGRRPLTRRHYAVVVGWDPERATWHVHDGGARPRRYARDELLARWRAAGGLALVVRDPVR